MELTREDRCKQYMRRIFCFTLQLDIFFSFLNENIVWNGRDRFAIKVWRERERKNVYFEELAR